MKAEELRVGNLVDVFGECCVTDIQTNITNGKHRIKVKRDVGGVNVTEFCPIESVKSIPLTEEWLLKFGFKLVNEVDYITVDFAIYEKDDIQWEESYSIGINYEWFDVEVKYVHQLQNLYFALTGKELK